jgi:hypothetical protein
MTDHEILLLAIGFTLGMYTMLAIHIAFGILDDRLDRKAARAAMAQLEAARAVADLPQSKSTFGESQSRSAETTCADLREAGEALR